MPRAIAIICLLTLAACASTPESRELGQRLLDASQAIKDNAPPKTTECTTKRTSSDTARTSCQ